VRLFFVGDFWEFNYLGFMELISIHPTTDARLIAQLNAEIQQLHHEMYPETFKAWDFEGIHAEMKKLMKRKDVSVFIAEVDSVPVGYIICWEILREENAFAYAQRTLYVDQLCVLEAYRGRKIGTQLMQFVEAIAVEKNDDFIEIHHWEDNVHAAKLYDRLNYDTFMKRRRKRVG